MESRLKVTKDDLTHSEKHLRELLGNLEVSKSQERSLSQQHEEAVRGMGEAHAEVVQTLARLSRETRQSCAATGISITPDSVTAIRQGQIYEDILIVGG